MKNTVIYIHGKNGSADEAEIYKPVFSEYEVIGLDYKAETPWQASAKRQIIPSADKETQENRWSKLASVQDRRGLCKCSLNRINRSARSRAVNRSLQTRDGYLK